MFLQSYVVAVCLFENRDGRAHLRSLEGTAFFVGRSGIFLTARHVIENALVQATEKGWEVGLAVKGEDGKSPDEKVVPLGAFEWAPKPHDVAVGVVDYRPESPLRLAPMAVAVWQEIASLGYPASALIKEGEALWMNLRAQRGYVQRTTLSRDIPFGEHPNGLELSFLLGLGMSGAPVFTIPDEIVIGVGVGSHRSEVVDDSIMEIADDGREYREVRLRIEQHGLAHSMNDLLGWRPSIFGGRSLIEAAS